MINKDKNSEKNTSKSEAKKEHEREKSMDRKTPIKIGSNEYYEEILTKGIDQVHNPHDHYFKGVSIDPDIMEPLIKSALPENISSKIHFDTMTVQNTNFVRDDLKERQSDVLLGFDYGEGGDKVWVYCLEEHKSSPDPEAVYQLFTYKGDIWERLKRLLPKGSSLVPIIPVLIIHGSNQIEYQKDFADLYGNIDPELKDTLLRFNVNIVDGNSLDDKYLEFSFKYRMFRRLLEAISKPKEVVINIFSMTLEEATKEEIEDSEWFIKFSATYVIGSKKGLDKKEFYEKVENKKTRKVFVNVINTLMEKGRKEGIDIGRKEGREKAIREKRKIAKNFKNMGIPNEKIAKAAGLSLEEVEKL